MQNWFVFSILLFLAAPAKAQPEKGLAFPDEAMSSLSWISKGGRQVQPDSKTEKKFRLIYLWGTWCSDCRQKLKGDLVTLASRPELDVVTVSIDKDETRLRQFLENEGISIAVRYDPEKSLQKLWKVYAVPFWTLWERNETGWSLKDSDKGLDTAKVSQAISVN